MYIYIYINFLFLFHPEGQNVWITNVFPQISTLGAYLFCELSKTALTEEFCLFQTQRNYSYKITKLSLFK